MKIESYKNDDEKNILTLFKKVFHFNLSINFWKWRFKNIYSSSPQIKLMWDNKNLIGHYGASEVEFIIKNKVEKSSLSLTTMTDENHTGKGIFPKLANALYDKLKNEKHALIYGFPNKNSHYGFIKKLNWKNIDLIPNLQLKKEHFNNISTSFSFNVFEEKMLFTPNHESAFLQITNGYSYKVNRNTKYLNWRYNENPLNKYTFFELPLNNVSYYAITKLYSSKDEYFEVDLVEFIFPNDVELINSLINTILKHYSNNKIKSINTWLPLNDEKYITLEKIGFAPNLPLTYLGYAPLNLSPEVVNKSDWYYSMGDSDLY